MAQASPLVSVAWLKEHLQQPDVRVLDASWFMPNMGALLSFLMYLFAVLGLYPDVWGTHTLVAAAVHGASAHVHTCHSELLAPCAPCIGSASLMLWRTFFVFISC